MSAQPRKENTPLPRRPDPDPRPGRRAEMAARALVGLWAALVVAMVAAAWWAYSSTP